LVTGNWAQLGYAVLADIFGWGEIKCQDPTEVTREHIRELVGWTLELPVETLPLQILLFREEDVNYFNGLDDQGEPTIEQPNLIYQKYGPLEDRGTRGLWTSIHMWNHLHLGY
jgi:hypothetical protein